MDKKKLIAAVVAVAVVVAGLLGLDIKGAVCGAPEAPAAAAK